MWLHTSSILLVLSLLAAACTGPTSEVASSSSQAVTSTTASASTTSTTSPPPSRPIRCSIDAAFEEVGVVAAPDLNEISGAAVSRRRPGIIWVHNDSGSEAEIIAITISGEVVERVALPDLTARDWEDMAIGPGPDSTVDYLYLADIGDNNTARDEVQIHRIPEPAPGVEVIAGGETLRLTYPQGATEAETLLVDPVGGDLLIAGKALSGITPIFVVPGDADWGVPQVADYAGDIVLGTFATATGGDATENRVLIRTYDEVFSWSRLPGQSLPDVLLSPGCRFASAGEPQGEAIALTADATAFYTLSEGIGQPIYRYSDTS